MAGASSRTREGAMQSVVNWAASAVLRDVKFDRREQSRLFQRIVGLWRWRSRWSGRRYPTEGQLPHLARECDRVVLTPLPPAGPHPLLQDHIA